MVLFIILNDLTFWNLKIRNDKKWDISLAGIWTNLLRSKLFGLHRIWPNKFVSYDFIHCLALSDPNFNVFLVILIYIIDTHVALLRHVLFWYLSSPHRYSTSVLVSIKKRILGNYFHNFVFRPIFIPLWDLRIKSWTWWDSWMMAFDPQRQLRIN